MKNNLNKLKMSRGKIKLEDIGEILQKIYDSEIHLRLGWFWDGGVDFLEGTKQFGVWEGLEDCLMRSTGTDDMCEAFTTMCYHLVAVYPKSDFATWFKGKFFHPLTTKS